MPTYVKTLTAYVVDMVELPRLEGLRLGLLRLGLLRLGLLRMGEAASRHAFAIY